MKKFSRSGTTSKIIHYSQPKMDRRFNYQDQKSLQVYNPTIELTGNLNIPTKSTILNNNVEFDAFRKVKVKNLPDSKRTLVPELNSEKKEIPRSKSSLNVKVNRDVTKRVLNPEENDYSNFLNDCGKTNKYPSKCNLEYQKSTVFSTNPNDCPGVKSHIKFNEYSKYNNTTQITYLPGGAKRTQNEINDDQKFIKGQLTRGTGKSAQKKIDVDYRSNISCLPNSAVRF